MPELVIDDRNYRDMIRQQKDAGFHAGYMGRVAPYGEMPHAIPAEEGFTLIPRGEWDDRIKQKDAEKSWLHDLIRDVQPCLFQNGLRYCHAYACASTIMTQRIVQGLPHVPLCPESIGGPITNWMNRGAYIDDDLAQAVKGGCCAMSYQDKLLSTSPRLWKPGWEQDALNHRITEWWDVPSEKAFDYAMSAALLSLPSQIGLNWWAHSVEYSLKARRNGNRYEILFFNSHGESYGDKGYAWLAEGKGTPDSMFIPRQVTPSDL